MKELTTVVNNHEKVINYSKALPVT